MNWLFDSITEGTLYNWELALGDSFFVVSVAILAVELIRYAVRKRLNWRLAGDTVTNFVTQAFFVGLGLVLFQLNLINQTLSEITGHYTTFKPMVGGVGTSEERRQSGIKQWFGWYNRKGKRFTENKQEDLIDSEFKPRNAKEQREYERALKELEKEKRLERDN